MTGAHRLSPMKMIRGWLLAIVPTFCVAQISQNQPQLCGTAGPPSALPVVISAQPNPGGSDLAIQLPDGSRKTLDLLADQIVKVCPVAHNRLLVFGTVNGGDGPFVWIVNQITGTQLDKLGSRSPAVSPDQHWVAYRQYYAPQAGNASDKNYLLYDLTKTPAENVMPSGDPQAPNPPGRLMYPRTPNYAPINDYLVDVPPEQEHNFASEFFFWSPDSRFVVFADRTGQQHPTTSIVVVRADNDALAAYVHPLQTSEVCTGDGLGPELAAGAVLSNVQFTSSSGATPDIFVSFSPQGWPLGQAQACTKRLLLNSANLGPADVENHTPLHRTGMTREVPRPK